MHEALYRYMCQYVARHALSVTTGENEACGTRPESASCARDEWQVSRVRQPAVSEQLPSLGGPEPSLTHDMSRHAAWVTQSDG